MAEKPGFRNPKEYDFLDLIACKVNKYWLQNLSKKLEHFFQILCGILSIYNQ